MLAMEADSDKNPKPDTMDEVERRACLSRKLIKDLSLSASISAQRPVKYAP